MLPKRVDEVSFGDLRIMYGKGTLYELAVEDKVFHYETTRQLSSQLMFRDKYLEAFGYALLPISNEAWTMVVNQFYATAKRYEQAELEEMWLRRVAQFVLNRVTDDQAKIENGYVYETNSCFIFTSTGMIKYLKQFEDMDVFTNEWHSEKTLTLLNCKSSSITLKDFKGRAVRLNKYSARVDSRFYSALGELIKSVQIA